MFSRFVSAVLDKTAPCTLSQEGRSSSGNIYKPPSSVDDAVICVSGSSSSLNAIAGSTRIHNQQDSGNGSSTKISVFKRVGSYSPARRQRKVESKLEKWQIIIIQFVIYITLLESISPMESTTPIEITTIAWEHNSETFKSQIKLSTRIQRILIENIFLYKLTYFKRTLWSIIFVL